MKSKILIFNLLIVAIVSISCQRDPLCYNHNKTARVGITVDWTKADMKPNGASLYVYDAIDGSLLFRELMPDPYYKELQLPVGEYHFMVFNDTEEDFNYLSFRDLDNLFTAKVVGVDDSRYRALEARATTSRSSVYEPTMLAVAHKRSVRVTEEMAVAPHSAGRNEPQVTFTMEPERIVAQMSVKVHVIGLSHLSQYVSPLVMIDGVSSGVRLHDLRTLNIAAKQYMELTTRTPDDKFTDAGTVGTSIYTFGLLDTPARDPKVNAGSIYMLDIVCRLSDHTTNYYPTSYPVNVTDKIKIDQDLHVKLEIELGLGTVGSGNDEPIVVPEPPGGGDPGGSSGGAGFDTSVSDWIETIVPLPL